MTATPLTFVPARRSADDGPTASRPAALTPHDAAQTSREDAVMLPRHIADAAYHVLQAIHALKDNGSHELFHALGKALEVGRYRPVPVLAPPCDVCHVEVAHGLPHHSHCWSDEAVSHRSIVLPQLAPQG